MNAVATVPMAGDLVELVGPAAEGVENRSLLLDKFVFHKKWPEAFDDRGHEIKWDEASRWSFLRIADGASQLLTKEAAEKRRKASSRNVEPQNRERLEAEAAIAGRLANLSWETRELADLRVRHTRRFLDLFRSAYGERAALVAGRLEGRLAINLADGLIQNAGICLDRLFGMPFIPGSAVKGVSRHAALEELHAAEGSRRAELYRIVAAVFGTAKSDFDPPREARRPGDKAKPAGDFHRYLDLAGAKDCKGAVSFLPAYPLNEAKVVVDLTNVHYPLYYQGDQKRNIKAGEESSLSVENPKPNPFPAVETGSEFAFCLVLNRPDSDPALLDHARRWLETALTVHGLGAKTASGYGWFSLCPDSLEAAFADADRVAAAAAKATAEAGAAAEAEQREKDRLASLDPEDAAAEKLLVLSDEDFAAIAKAIGEQEALCQRAFISLMRDHKEKRERWKTWKKKKPEIADPIREAAAKLGLPPLP